MLTVVSGGTVLSLILPALVQGYHLEPALISWLLSLMSVWLVLGVAAFWLGWRGWRAFVQRPHPFLAG
jgi:ABC-type nickel/cobalt efflux system permease component RcnA